MAARKVTVEPYPSKADPKSWRCVWRYGGVVQKTKRMAHGVNGDGLRYMKALAAAIEYLNFDIADTDPRLTSGALVHEGVNAVAPGESRDDTLGYWLDQWLANRVDVSDESIGRYEDAIKHLTPWRGVSVLAWNAAKTAQVKRALLVSGNAGKPLAPRTVNGVIVRLGGALKTARAAGLAVPYQEAGSMASLRAPKAGKRISPDQYRVLLSRIPAGDARDVIEAAFGTSMRQGEILALTAGSIVHPVRLPDGSMTLPYVTVNANAIRRTREIGRTKTAESDRDVDLSPETYALLMKRAAGKAPGELLFPSPMKRHAGKPRSAISVWKVFHAAVLEMVAAGELPSSVRFHDLRGSASSLLLAAGVPSFAVAERNGHSEQQLMKDYAHTDTATKARIAGVLSAALGAPEPEPTPVADEMAARRQRRNAGAA